MNKDTETKFEKTENLEDDYYDYNNDNNIMDVALGNIKDDPASIRSRPRRLKYWQLTLEDEDKIPKMPEKILKQPNEENFNKEIEKLKSEKNQKGKNISDLYNKITEEKTGIKQEDKVKLNERKKELKKRKDELKSILENEDKGSEEIREELRNLTDEVRKYERYHFSKNPNVILNQIRDIKEKLSFSELSSTEEKQLMEKKPLLEEYYKPCKKLYDFKINNKDKLTKKNVSEREELKKINEELKKINDEIKIVFDKKNESKPIIQQYKVQIESLKKDKEEIQKKIDESYEKFYQDKYEYDKQQRFIQYIKKCQEQINKIKKRNEKEKKRKLKEEKKKKKDGEESEETLKDIEITKRIVKKYDNQIKECEELKNYFSALLPKEEENKEIEEKEKREKTKLDEDLEKGILKPITQKNYDDILGISEGDKKKKKEKNLIKIKKKKEWEKKVKKVLKVITKI